MSDKLTDWRKQIDALDAQLLSILAKRAAVVKKIGSHKKEQGISPLDRERWETVLRSRVNQAEALGLNRDFTGKLFSLIHEFALEIEEQKIQQ
jgi:chorismate mutase